MAHTYESLRKMTIAQLRGLAKGLDHEAVQGYTQMKKDQLLPALCAALGIEAHEHHAAALAEKAGIKTRMRDLRAKRAEARGTGDHDALRQIRREYHRLNHALRTSAKHAER
ncbi:MAG: hypothetical protein R2752_13355 [Vicinamibacterales bacterium]